MRVFIEGCQHYRLRVEVIIEISPRQCVCHSVVLTLDVDNTAREIPSSAPGAMGGLSEC
jgi:hypothetical protein